MQLKGHIFGQYRFQNLLRTGGMAEVYLAHDERLDRQVAIKVIWTDSSHYEDIERAREAVRLFLREAQTLAKFDNRHILPIFDSGEGEISGISFMYLVMPYRHEGSLSDWIHNNNKMGQLSIWDVDRIVQQAASALQHAHDFNIIHQDVKTSNFLIHGHAQFPSQLELQLADFGIAKFMTTSSNTLEIRGTPRYMAPEQWDNRPAAATDQYALAVMVYELLTGRPPFTGTTKEQLWHQHSHAQPPLPGSLNPAIPYSLDTVILRALAKQPEQRFVSVTAFASAFRKALLNGKYARPLNPARSDASMSLSSLSTVERTVPVLPPSAVPASPPEYIKQDFPQREEPPKHSWRKIIALLVLISIILLGSGGMLYLTWSYQQKVFTDSTATALALTATTGNKTKILAAQQTDNTNATNTIVAQQSATNAYATATQTSLMQTVVAKNATATKVASDTTATVWAGITSGTLIFNDSLQSSNPNSNWDASTGNPNDNNCSFTGGQYHATVQQTLYPVQPCFAQNTDFTDCTYLITMSIISGDQGGVLFRGNEANGTFYYFYININGTFGIDIFNHDSYQTTLKEDISTAIVKGQKQINQIAVVATGYTFQLYVNKAFLATVQDTQSSFSHGEIGIAAWSKGNPTDVAFTNAQVLLP